jgi:DNA-binding transcriptional MerR regulator
MGKSETAFRTISEVAGELDIPQHVLRFWEGRFNQIKPLKRAGGRRYYRPEDVDLIKRIRDLLYAQGYTIKGVQKLLREKGASPEALAAVPPPRSAQLPAPAARSLQEDAQPTKGQLSLLPQMAPPVGQPAVADQRKLLTDVLKELLDMKELLSKAAI